jgi:hypothetical protein
MIMLSMPDYGTAMLDMLISNYQLYWTCFINAPLQLEHLVHVRKWMEQHKMGQMNVLKEWVKIQMRVD